MSSGVLDLSAFRPANRIIWLLITAMTGGLAVSYWAAGLSLDLRSGWMILTVFPLCFLVAWYYRCRRIDPWISAGTEAAGQLTLILLLGTLLSYAAAAPAFPYRDAMLYTADKTLGFDWLSYLAFFNSHPTIGYLGNLAYFSMKLQMPIVLIALIATSRIARLQQFIVATVASLTITLAVFTFVPAVAYYAYLGIHPSDFSNLTPSTPYAHIRHLEGIRSGLVHIVRLNDLEGLITFPSFHTVSALLYVWALWPIRRLRWPAVVLNILMIASTPIDGAHYAIDIIGGIIVAIIAIVLTTYVTGVVCARSVAQYVTLNDPKGIASSKPA
ncbi:phosphatase PAP2 family protein [Nitrobacter sp.]|jgi:membrane-associated phospholipid phosphatase|uniref:phosphatase PAP2 family protein n=1 Tax=Nitrobacter sp. TaxID=29420 RepID=UPI003F64F730